MMNNLAEDLLQETLLNAQSQCDEISPFLMMVHRLSELLHQSLELEEISKELVRIVIEETDFENCSILLKDPETYRLRLVAAYGLEDLLGASSSLSYHKDLSFTASEGIAGQVFESKRALFIEGTGKDHIPPKTGSIIEPVSLASLPILDLGILNISTQHPHEFSPQSRRNWEIFGKIVGCLIREAFFRKQGKELKGATAKNRGSACEISRDQRERTLKATLSEQALSRTPQGICILDTEGNIARINTTIERFLGAGAKEITGRSPSLLFRDPAAFKEVFGKLAQSDHVELGDTALVNSEGAVYLADIFLTRLADHGESPAGYLLVINDMSKKMALIEKTHQKEKLAALGTMAGGVAHDFNNLLMSILGNIELMLPRITEEEIRRRLHNIKKAVHDGAHCVRRLQRFTAIDREQGALVASVDVSEAIKDVLELTRPRWKDAKEKHGHTITLQMELEPQCRAAIHASDLREVVTNLIFNALDAMPQGGVLTLRSRCLNDEVIIEVSDTGTGMSEELTRKIFDPFYTTKGVENSGLGLSVSWSLISRYGGDLQVRSKQGRGSVFVIKLPGAENSQKSMSPSKMSDEAESQKILLVDDNLEVLETLRDMLRLKGHEVIAVSKGEDALQLIEEKEFDFVLTDLGMPRVSGLDIARRVKIRHPRTQVILITGWGEQLEKDDPAASGVDLVLSKPLSWEDLTKSIEKGT